VTIYVFRVWLHPNPPLGFEPDDEVRRDIEIDGSHTLAQFHEAVFEEIDRFIDRAVPDDASDAAKERFRDLQSPAVVEDLLFLGCLHAPFEQAFPDFPQYWEPETELDYQVAISDDVHERLLAVIGQSIHPDRLRRFDDSYRFDLERAADEYGPANDA
jgi:hypothetical protein